MTHQREAPVLLIIFNRPDKTRKIIKRLAEIQPSRVYISADGPRLNSDTDQQACQEARMISESEIRWPCQIKTRFLTKNLGCKRGVATAIDWFFEHEEEGIILEDDCIPHPEFFEFCAQLLDRYRTERRVWLVSGDNSAGIRLLGDYSYAFIREPLIWGWATWKRSWLLYDRDMTRWKKVRQSPLTEALFDHRDQYMIRSSVYDRVANDEIDTWDYQLSASMRIHGGLCIVPRVNLVSNIGFDETATHTKSLNPRSNIGSRPILPLRHPPAIIADPIANEDVFTRVQGGVRLSKKAKFLNASKRWLRRWLIR